MAIIHGRHDCLCRVTHGNYKKSLGLIHELTKVPGYKVNLQKSIAYLQITNEQLDIEIKQCHLQQHRKVPKYKSVH